METRFVLCFHDEIAAHVAQLVRDGWGVALIREASTPLCVKLKVAAVRNHCHTIAAFQADEYSYNYALPKLIGDQSALCPWLLPLDQQSDVPNAMPPLRIRRPAQSWQCLRRTGAH